MGDAYIIGATRCATARARRGVFKNVRPDDLCGLVINNLLERTKALPSEVEDLKLGCAMPEGEQGMNVAKIIQFLTKLPPSVPAMTVNRFCASGLQSIVDASYQVMAGDAEVIIAGGVESMTRVPMGGFTPRPNPKLCEELIEAYTPMGITAENVADKWKVTREEQDDFAYHSHRKAAEATKTGRFKEEIFPVEVVVDGKKIIHQTDETIREDTTREGLSQLKPAFKEGGSVTAGNSSPLTDGAAVTLMVSKEKAKKMGATSAMKLVSAASIGVPPELMGIGPAYAIPKALKLAGIKLEDIDLFELNEAFAAQAVAVVKELKMEKMMTRINVNGGAIALGHPLGCSGARLTTTLFYEMMRRGAKYGVVSMCIGGGQGMAAIFKRVKIK